jgi:Na+/melibiose symporter-like transporter
MNRWLARLSFSFFIVGIVLAWQGYQATIGNLPHVPGWKIAVEFLAAIILFVLGAIGIRERHRHDI